MIGDVIHIKPEYLNTASDIIDLCGHNYFEKKRIALIAGESGSGKSVTAISLQKELLRRGVDAFVLHQDDYFHLPPASNHAAREADISRVGPQEVDLALLQAHLDAFAKGEERLTKPLVYYKENQILQETINMAPYQVLIIEGTYALALERADLHIFMERNYHDTLPNRKARMRDVASEFVEQVLEVEHRIIAPMVEKAHILIRKNYQAERL